MTVGAFFDNGYMLALLMFLVTLVQNSLLQTHYHLVIREGIRLRAALQVSCVIYCYLQQSVIDLNRIWEVSLFNAGQWKQQSLKTHYYSHIIIW